MTLSSLKVRLRRLERARLPAEPKRALTLQVRPDEEVAPRVAEQIAAGTYRSNWPLLIVRAADWPAHHEGRIGGIAR